MNTVTNLLARARRRASRTALLACAATLLPCLAHAYSLPVRGDSLQVGERFSTFVHQAGIQALGKDINVVRRQSDSSWPELKAGASDTTVLTNWLDYGKSVYAMAPGTIIACWRNSPQNTPGTMRSEVGVTISRAGNHLWVLQDDGVYALYAHMQPGSIPTALCPHNEQFMPNDAAAYTDPKKPDVAKPALVSRGAHISAGQKLGLLGNSGASEHGPHLHVHMEKDGQPVAMTFGRGMTEVKQNGAWSYAGPWTRLAGNAMPMATILVWPPHPVGSWTFKGTPGVEYQALFDHMADSGEMPSTIACASGGATYDATWVPSQGQWVSYAGMSWVDFVTKDLLLTAQGYTRTSTFNCGTVVAVWRK